MKIKSLKSPIKITPLLILLVGLLLSSILIAGFYSGTRYQKSLILEKEHSLPPDTDTNGVIYPSATPITKPPSTTQPSPVANIANYPVPQSWIRINILNGLTLCLPSKWEADQWGNIYFNRDPAYRPNVTYIQEIPYPGGSRRESFYTFWEREYPSVRQTVGVNEASINKDTVLKFNGPEGEKIVWLANGKLWQAGISGWSIVNDSKTLFLKDFYTMISCSF